MGKKKEVEYIQYALPDFQSFVFKADKIEKVKNTTKKKNKKHIRQKGNSK